MNVKVGNKVTVKIDGMGIKAGMDVEVIQIDYACSNLKVKWDGGEEWLDFTDLEDHLVYGTPLYEALR